MGNSDIKLLKHSFYVYPYRMTRGSAVVLRLCRRSILWLVGALIIVILFHLYFIKGTKTITTRENDHFPPLPKEFLSPSHTKVSMNRLYHYSLERAVNSSPRKHPFLLALRRWGRFAKLPQRRRARRNGFFRRLSIALVNFLN